MNKNLVVVCLTVSILALTVSIVILVRLFTTDAEITRFLRADNEQASPRWESPSYYSSRSYRPAYSETRRERGSLTLDNAGYDQGDYDHSSGRRENLSGGLDYDVVVKSPELTLSREEREYRNARPRWREGKDERAQRSARRYPERADRTRDVVGQPVNEAYMVEDAYGRRQMVAAGATPEKLRKPSTAKTAFEGDDPSIIQPRRMRRRLPMARDVTQVRFESDDMPLAQAPSAAPEKAPPGADGGAVSMDDRPNRAPFHFGAVIADDDGGGPRRLPAQHAVENLVADVVLQNNLYTHLDPGPFSRGLNEETKGLKISMDGLKYTHTDYGGAVKAESDEIAGTLRLSLPMDKMTLDIGLPLQHVGFDGDYGDYGYSRYGLIVSPRYRFKTEDIDGPFTIEGGVTAFGIRTVGNKSLADSTQYGMGLYTGVSKTLGKAILNGGATWQHAFATAGDEIIDSGLDAFRLGMRVGMPVTEKFTVNGRLIYNSTFGLTGIDGEWTTMGLGGSYAFSDTILLEMGYERDQGYRNGDRIAFALGYVLDF